MIRKFVACVAALAFVGCTVVKVGPKNWAFAPGKGCVVHMPDGTIIAESDGISINLSSAMQAMASVLGGVLGRGGEKSEKAQGLAAGEGCRGAAQLISETYESPTY